MAATTILDPICDMVVDIAGAREAGLALERPEREYAFCCAHCLATFAKTPERFVPKVEAWLAAGGSGPAHGGGKEHAPAD